MGTAVTINGTASHTAGGTISRVEFRANSVPIASDTSSPYSVSWTNMPAGVYAVTAVATDNLGRTTTSNSINVKISKALKSVRNTRRNASVIEGSITSASSTTTANADKIDIIVTELEQTYIDFHAERAMFDSAKRIETYLFAATFLARSSASLAKHSMNSAVSDRMSKLDAYLGFCEDLMANGVISNNSLNVANQTNAKVNLLISQPNTQAMNGSGLMLSPNGEGMITAVAGSPFASGTMNVSHDAHLFELGNVSVSINGKAAEMLYVSPTLVTFIVPGNALGGLASVVVTSREGFISHSISSVSGLNPTIFLNLENSSQGVIFDGLNVFSGMFSTVTPAQYLGLDTRTRLSLMATGISTGVQNTDSSNDIWLGNGQRQANLAESVVVQARKSDGTTLDLPVEYAGIQPGLTGMDQVNVILPQQLNGAGSVQLTVVIGGIRSNTVTINVQ